jgi:hypothetical protein
MVFRPRETHLENEMAKDFIFIGGTPAEEPCVGINERGDYHEAMKAECRRFIAFLRAHFGREPVGAALKVKSQEHDFGTYYEVVCWYDDQIEAAVDYAYQCEGEAPSHWNDPLPDGTTPEGYPFTTDIVPPTGYGIGDPTGMLTFGAVLAHKKK